MMAMQRNVCHGRLLYIFGHRRLNRGVDDSFIITIFTFPAYDYRAYVDIVLVTVSLMTPVHISQIPYQSEYGDIMSKQSMNSCSGI
jgi:hypothetical protein